MRLGPDLPARPSCSSHGSFQATHWPCGPELWPPKPRPGLCSACLDVSPPPWGILLSSGPKPATLSTSQLLQAKLSYHGAWGTRRAWGPWFCYDLGLGRVRGGLVVHCPTTPHSPTLELIGHWRSTPWVLGPELHTAPRRHCGGRPSAGLGSKDGPEASPPPPPLP